MRLGKCIFVVAVLLWFGCERDHASLGGVKSALRGAPQYDTKAEISLRPASANVQAIAPSVDAGPIDGAAVYAKSCGACHQANGMGIPNAFPPLVNSPYVIGDNVERMAAIMVYGLVGPITVLGQEYNSAMAGLGAQFSDEELAAVATYVRSSWGHTASAVEASVFTAVREKWGARGPFNIKELGEES